MSISKAQIGTAIGLGIGGALAGGLLLDGALGAADIAGGTFGYPAGNISLGNLGPGFLIGAGVGGLVGAGVGLGIGAAIDSFHPGSSAQAMNKLFEG